MNLRKFNPSLYREIVIHSIIQIGMAVNFWNFNPAFNPSVFDYVINKNIVAWIFFILGLWNLTFLHVWRHVDRTRIGLTVAAGVGICWGIMNTQQIFAGNASWQLPIFVVGVSCLELNSLRDVPGSHLMESS